MIEYPRYLSLPEDYLRVKFNEFLLEDAPNGDITSSGTVSPDSETVAQLEAESDLIFAGKSVIEAAIEDVGKCEIFVSDGEKVYSEQLLAKLYGKSKDLLERERTLLNLLQRLCGIATMTNRYVSIAEPYNVKILDTRKTTPGLRLFEKFAVAVGGGYNHRLDLSSGILIKDNHIKAAGSITDAVKKIKEYNSVVLANTGMNRLYPIEVEVENLHEIDEALSAGVDGFLLDNMSPELVGQSVKKIRSSPTGYEYFIEASGGINLINLKDYVRTGINAVSVGAITHSVRSSVLHLEFVK